jgi:uncharacterized protein YgiM (DUF1202 family)
MKKNCWLILGMVLSISFLAQPATSQTPSAPIQTPAAATGTTLAPATTKTNPPAAKAVKKDTATKKAEKAPAQKAVAKKKEALPELKTVPLVPGPAVVVASNVNVRGQAKLKSEVVTQVTKGQSVTVIEEIVRNYSGPEEPSAWAKIVLPPKAHVWVHNSFINPTNQTVLPKRLNLRSGPGENYSVIGLLHRGDAVKGISTKEDWTEIEPPTNAYAFVAAQYLKQEAPTPPAPPPPPPEPAPTPATVAVAPPVAPPPAEAPTVPPPAVTPEMTNAPTEPETPVVEEPPPPRIVQREGIVRGMTSIQAPSRFVLVSPDSGRNIDYLYTTSQQLDLRRYKGLRIIVTGEESLDERWGKTPVLTIQRIQVVEE